jgi:hypothetical protein
MYISLLYHNCVNPFLRKKASKHPKLVTIFSLSPGSIRKCPLYLRSVRSPAISHRRSLVRSLDSALGSRAKTQLGFSPAHVMQSCVDLGRAVANSPPSLRPRASTLLAHILGEDAKSGPIGTGPERGPKHEGINAGQKQRRRSGVSFAAQSRGERGTDNLEGHCK